MPLTVKLCLHILQCLVVGVCVSVNLHNIMDCSTEFTVPFCLSLTYLVETVNTQAVVFWGMWNR